MAICCTCNDVQACPCSCHNAQPVSNVGEGFWLARYELDTGPTETPVHVWRSCPGDNNLYVWGFSVYEGVPAYRTQGVRLETWLQQRPDVTFVPDLDRTKDEPAPAPPKPDPASPDYYHATLKSVPFRIECIDVIDALGFNYNVGTAFAYLWRLDRKGGPDDAVLDIEKAVACLQREVVRRKRGT